MTNRQYAMQDSHQCKIWNKHQLMLQAAEQSSEISWRKTAEEKPVLTGVVQSARVNGDWHWHFAEAVPSENAEVSFYIPAGMTFGLIYRGELELQLGPCKHHLKTDEPLAFCFTNSTPMRVTRRFKAGALVHKFTLGISRGWLSTMGLEAFIPENQQLRAFSASNDVLTAVNSLLTLPKAQNIQHKLQQITNVTTLLNAAGAVLDEGNAPNNAERFQTPASPEKKLLDCVREIIQRENILLEEIHVDDLAKSLGLSASGIQRIAKKCFGQSLLKHIRQAKLANAFRAIKDRNFSIGEAAFLAGYKQASNFSLAFRKVYGYSPGEISRAKNIGSVK